MWLRSHQWNISWSDVYHFQIWVLRKQMRLLYTLYFLWTSRYHWTWGETNCNHINNNKILTQCFLNYNMHIYIAWWILLKCSFKFSRPEMGSEILRAHQTTKSCQFHCSTDCWKTIFLGFSHTSAPPCKRSNALSFVLNYLFKNVCVVNKHLNNRNSIFLHDRSPACLLPIRRRLRSLSSGVFFYHAAHCTLPCRNWGSGCCAKTFSHWLLL